jgi:hypothetical protein
VKPADAVVVVVPTVGISWVIVPGGIIFCETVRVKVQSPASPDASESVPEAVHVPGANVPVVFMAPAEETATPQAVEVVTKVAGPIWPAVTR